MLVGRQSNPSPEFLFSNRIYSSHAATFTTLPRRTQNKTAIFQEICYNTHVSYADWTIWHTHILYIYIYIYMRRFTMALLFVCMFNIKLCKYIWLARGLDLRGFQCVRLRIIVCAYDMARLSETFFFATPRILHHPLSTSHIHTNQVQSHRWPEKFDLLFSVKYIYYTIII